MKKWKTGLKDETTEHSEETLRTLKEYPLRDITEKIISCVPISRESTLITWVGLLENLYEEAIKNIHIAQVLTYLREQYLKVGLLINFNVDKLKEGIRRVI